MKNTVLTAVHEALGAKMLPFAGYNMPILYEGVNAEHETVRTAVRPCCYCTTICPRISPAAQVAAGGHRLFELCTLK